MKEWWGGHGGERGQKDRGKGRVRWETQREEAISKEGKNGEEDRQGGKGATGKEETEKSGMGTAGRSRAGGCWGAMLGWGWGHTLTLCKADTV